MKTIFCLICAVLMSGCATRPMYNWGDYEKNLYESYSDPVKVADFRSELEEIIADVEGDRKKVAPGLYAELGTVYLQAGDKEKAVMMYKKERDTWPESRYMMNAMIKNLERKPEAQTHAEASK